MNILLHICCGPCAIYPARQLRQAGYSVTGFFFNHNIHPFQEYQRRLDAAREMCRQEDIKLICRDEYRLEEFLSAVAQNPADRCIYCYFSRFDAVAREAAAQGFDAFSSSLLYSRYQNHELIRNTGDRAAERHGIKFHYDDFRPGWQEGIRVSKEMGLYRQQYCGCIYSEKERYLPKGRHV